MILQALNAYYDRLAARDDPPVPPYGYSDENISYALTLDKDGAVVNVTPLLDDSGKKPRPTVMEVPRAIKRTSGIASNFLWDKSAYVLGVARDKVDMQAVVESPREHAAFKKLHEKDDCTGNRMDILQEDIQHGRPKLVEEMYVVWGCIE